MQSAEQTVDVPAEPGISVHKEGCASSFSAPGTSLTYPYVIKNTGKVALNPVTLADTKVAGRASRAAPRRQPPHAEWGHETKTDTVKVPATAMSMVMLMSALNPWTNALAT